MRKEGLPTKPESTVNCFFIYHADHVQADFTEDNPFSQPWEDSDLALVVEGQRFHVHRLILTLNSPVFKAMLTSSFKEATSGEITLPEKNANEVLGFVKQLYVHKREEITSKFNRLAHLKIPCNSHSPQTTLIVGCGGLHVTGLPKRHRLYIWVIDQS